MKKKLFIAGFFTFLIGTSGCVNKSEKIAELERKINELEELTEKYNSLDEELIDAVYELKNIAQLYAADALEGKLSFANFFIDNSSLMKVLWQEYMPEKITVNADLTFENRWDKPTLIKVEQITENLDWEGRNVIIEINNENFTHGNTFYFDGLPNDIDFELGTANWTFDLYKSPFNRQYLFVDPEKCVYNGFLLCNGGSSDANMTKN